MRLETFEEKHLQEAEALWNEAWGAVFPMRERLLRQNTVEDVRLLRAGSWIARETPAGPAAGLVTAKFPRPGDELRFGLRPDTGWIQALVVSPAGRGRGIGSLLLSRAEEALRQAGARRIVLGGDLHRRMFPGVPAESTAARAWLERRGYTHREDAFDLVNHYGAAEAAGAERAKEASGAQGAIGAGEAEEAIEAVEAVEATGAGKAVKAGKTGEAGKAVFRAARPGDREALTAFMARCFPGGWDLQQRDYWNSGGTGREYMLLELEGRLAGFCRMNTQRSPLLAQNVYWAPLFEGELGGIGPLGIDPACRGGGYGLAIVQAADRALRLAGMRHIVIDTTPFVEFYGKLGYTPWKRYAKYDKTLEPLSGECASAEV
ncbi:GNAT family N-acetyltransferase [Saccharibacillus sp. CPCC 101409]|uniref:GNAT family N-acetyltransferase n=1 Tax=Saccharibacillus sp. CPCC 101409 TaxID=3058041 RepID=UPI002673AA5D|nr:GNAT family N-acetyltransferase [Saccharibacillus sp. CPCC 101409]MDO3409962.1 GNAT family N-acetyltransferase [Saccharibacillus sp. CPCC 101409]